MGLVLKGAEVAVGGDTGQAGLTGLRLFHARDKNGWSWPGVCRLGRSEGLNGQVYP